MGLLDGRAAGGKALANGDDIGTRAGARALVAACADAFGGIHALVNNAGNARDRSFLKMSDEEFQDVFRVHVYGSFACAQEAALRMKEQGTGGSIVNTVIRSGLRVTQERAAVDAAGEQGLEALEAVRCGDALEDEAELGERLDPIAGRA